MQGHVLKIGLLVALVVLSACQPGYETEGDRLQRVGEQTVSGIDTTGLEALQ